MELSMRRSVISFRVLSLKTVSLKTFFAIVEIKALIALVPHICNGHCATSIAFDCFSYCLTRFHYNLNAVFFRVIVAAYLQTFKGCSEVAILAHTKMRATCTYKTGADHWFHITTDTLVIAMGCQPIS